MIFYLYPSDRDMLVDLDENDSTDQDVRTPIILLVFFITYYIYFSDII